MPAAQARSKLRSVRIVAGGDCQLYDSVTHRQYTIIATTCQDELPGVLGRLHLIYPISFLRLTRLAKWHLGDCWVSQRYKSCVECAIGTLEPLHPTGIGNQIATLLPLWSTSGSLGLCVAIAHGQAMAMTESNEPPASLDAIALTEEADDL